jgi:uncharacterized protein DUF1837
LKKEFDQLLEVQRREFEKLFAHVSHELECLHIPAASLRLHYIRHDATGEPRIKKLAETIVDYITQYSFSLKRREGLTELQRNQTFRQARQLFRDTPDSGQAGELLVYLFIEAVLGAPQILKKMPITTNPNDERKGSDGVHMRWNNAEGILEIIFAEAKIWATFSGALTDAFASMNNFHSSRIKDHEVNLFSNFFSELSPELQQRVISYLDGPNIEHSRETHACLIGYNWKDYDALNQVETRAALVKEFDLRYRAWAEKTMLPALTKQVEKFKHKHLAFEFFFIPFPDVATFRKHFNEAL